MNKILLSIPLGVNDENGIEESPALLRALDAATIKNMIQRVEKVQALRQEDSDVFSMTRHSFSGQVYDRSVVSDLFEGLNLYDECSVELTEEQYRRIEQEIEEWGQESASMRVECRQEHYLDDGVYFTALVKHTSIELESQGLGLDTLQGYLARLDDDDSEEFSYPSGDSDRERFGNE